ncbi:MAG TPA: homoserine kinase [Acidimicrobiales bacterium]|nr:homoserine kinase [Acidimicrobiales bacterium]
MRARAPSSTANLGPGFDVLALALDLYVEVEVEKAPRLSVRAEGEGAELADDASHLAARVAIDVTGHEGLSITVRSDIPVARGLGSSAALAVAAAAAAGSKDPLGVAARVDGHPENAAASVVGGLVAATSVRGAVRAVRLPLDPGIHFVAVVPERPLPTTKARQVLPHQVARADATFNLGRLTLLLAGLADRALLTKEATEDRLHQDYRSPLFPEAPQLLSRLVSAGALASCWSGAGPTLLGLCEATEAERVRDGAERAMEEVGVAGRAVVLRPDLEGLVVDGSPPDGRSRPRRLGSAPFDLLADDRRRAD